MYERLLTLLELDNIHPTQIQKVSGGDINDSFQVQTQDGTHLFVKINFPNQPIDILISESQGLEMMGKAGVINIPTGVNLRIHQSDAALIMPFYTPGNTPQTSEWMVFFENLGRMHLLTNEYFGGRNNFIGTLPQINHPRNNWIPFFRENRLQPQFTLAMDRGYLDRNDLVKFDRLLLRLPEYIPIERPALIHGDLWSGNILSTATKGILMIDACPYYGHREMDFAMMTLFSGVPVKKDLPSYEEIYPLTPGLMDRIEIYQLYYLLTHLNMFGAAYLPGIRRIIHNFS